MKLYILDSDGNPVVTTDLFEFSAFFNKCDRKIQVTELQDCRLSTCFIGINHNFSGDGPPLIYESMWFGGLYDGISRRYSNEIDARIGHLEMLLEYQEETECIL